MGGQDNTLAYIFVALISAISTIIVALISRKIAPKVKLRTVGYYGGYEKWAEYMQTELTKAHESINGLQEEVEKFKEQLYRERQRTSRMRAKLLWFSRKYNVDVSEVI